MNKEYLDRNALGFEGDFIAREKFRHIVESNGIDTIVETGTYLGNTTKWLCQWVDKVYTIEANQENYNSAKRNLAGIKNLTMILGNSAERIHNVLKQIAPVKEEGKEKLIKDKPVFFFLDAHWNEFNPLLDELEAISQYYVKPFIAIHDFKVPGNADMGFDSYGGQDYEWSWIEEKVERIYGKKGFDIEYNSEATGAKRGIIYISPRVSITVQIPSDTKNNSLSNEDVDHINQYLNEHSKPE